MLWGHYSYRTDNNVVFYLYLGQCQISDRYHPANQIFCGDPYQPDYMSRHSRLWWYSLPYIVSDTKGKYAPPQKRTLIDWRS